jgi:YfiH family protein
LLTATLGRVRIWCSDRNGGVSRPPYDGANIGDHVGDDPAYVAENRSLLAAAAGLPEPAEWVWMEQVHGTAVHVAGGPSPEPPVADAIVTAKPGLPIAVMTADCAPIVLAADEAVGVVHAGHRGLVDGVVGAAVREMQALGARRISAFLGPCIRVERYEFGADDLARAVAVLGPDVEGRTSRGTPAFDLTAGVRIALARAGVDHLVDCGVCTSASGEHFSYRRDGTTGRQVTVAMLP